MRWTITENELSGTPARIGHNLLQESLEFFGRDPGLEKNCLERLWRKGLFGVDGNGDDGTAPGVVEIMVAAPDANHLKAGFLQSPDHLLPGDSREFHLFGQGDPLRKRGEELPPP